MEDQKLKVASELFQYLELTFTRRQALIGSLPLLQLGVYRFLASGGAAMLLEDCQKFPLPLKNKTCQLLQIEISLQNSASFLFKVERERES